MLDRDTKWRQGDLLTQETAEKLNLISSQDENFHVVVISHDCDIPNTNEPKVEVIIAHAVDQADGQLSYTKNPRRLHLKYTQPNKEPLILELLQTNKQAVKKSRFSKQAKQHPATLSNKEKRVLKQWLAARYGRPAFPDAFERRLRRKANSRRDVKSQIARILKPDSKHLVALFFDLGEQRGIEEPADEPYVLSISVVYDAIEGSSTARQSAERVAQEIKTLFIKVYGEPEEATEIALEKCEAVADTHMTLSDLRRVDQWRLEHLSLRDEQSGDFLAAGEYLP